MANPYRNWTGAIAVSEIDATGTPSSNTALFGDGTWKVASSGGAVFGVGSPDVLTKWSSAAATLVDSLIAESGSTITLTGRTVLTGAVSGGASTFASLSIAGGTTLGMLQATATTVGTFQAGASTVSALQSGNTTVTGFTAGASTIASLIITGTLQSSASSLVSLSVSGGSTLGTLQAGASTHTSLSVSGGSTVGTLQAGASTVATLSAGNSTVAAFTAGNSTVTSLTITALAAVTTPAQSWIGPASTVGIYFKGGKVGIGTTDPLSPLTLFKSDTIVGEIMSWGNLTNGRYGALGSNPTGAYIAGWNLTPVIQIDGATSNVGIGTTTPLATLHIEGSTARAGVYLNSAVPSTTTYTLYNNAGTLMWNGSPIGSSGGTIGGTANKIAKFTTSSNVGDSILSESGSSITLSSGTFTLYDYFAASTAYTALQTFSKTIASAAKNVTGLGTASAAAACRELSLESNAASHDVWIGRTDYVSANLINRVPACKFDDDGFKASALHIADYENPANLSLRRARVASGGAGNAHSDTGTARALLSGERIGHIHWQGLDTQGDYSPAGGSGNGESARISCEAAENFSTSAKGGKLNFWTCPTGANEALSRWEIFAVGDLVPAGDNAYYVGHSSRRAKDIFAVTKTSVLDVSWGSGKALVSVLEGPEYRLYDEGTVSLSSLGDATVRFDDHFIEVANTDMPYRVLTGGAEVLNRASSGFTLTGRPFAQVDWMTVATRAGFENVRWRDPQTDPEPLGLQDPKGATIRKHRDNNTAKAPTP